MRRCQIGVALLILLMSFTFFLVDAIVCSRLGCRSDLQKPAWAMFAIATSYFFNIPLSSLLRLILHLLDHAGDDQE